MDWRHYGLPSHIKFRVQKPLEMFSPRFFGIKTHPLHLLSFKGLNYVLFLHDNARLTGDLQPRRNWPTWTSSVLITYPFLRIWPRRTTSCSLDWKNNWKVAIFRPPWRSLLPRRPGWTDKLLNILSGLQKLEQRAKNCIELRGEYVE